MTKRIEWIDFIKGVTIFLVVIGHVINGLIYSNNFNTHLTVLNFTKDWIYSFHMPLFFLLSGFFFRRKKNIIKDIANKFISLIFPYIFFSIVLFLLKYLGSSSVREPLTLKDLLSIPIQPVEYLWFIYVLFFIYVLINVLCYFIKTDLYILILLIFLACLNIQTGLVAIDRTLYESLYFFLGYLIFNNKDIYLFKIKQRFSISSISMLVITIILINIPLSSLNQIILILFALTGSNFIISLCYIISDNHLKFIAYFKKIGQITMPIYLLHSPIASVTRIILLKIGINSVLLHILFGISMSWFLSILIYTLLKKIKLFNFIIFPNKYIRI